jgi:hypothetical protein
MRRLLGGPFRADLASRQEIEPGVISNCNAEEYVCQGDSPSGAHSDIFKPELAWMVASAARLAASAASGHGV